jgi:hypothetical protein
LPSLFSATTTSWIMILCLCVTIPFQLAQQGIRV